MTDLTLLHRTPTYLLEGRLHGDTFELYATYPRKQRIVQLTLPADSRLRMASLLVAPDDEWAEALRAAAPLTADLCDDGLTLRFTSRHSGRHIGLLLPDNTAVLL